MNTLVSLITRTESGVRAMRLRMLANSVLIWLSSCSENRQSVSTQKKRLRTMSNGALGSAFSACSPRTSELQPTPPGPYSSTELALLRMRMDVRRFSASSRPTSLKPGRAASISEPEIRYWFVIRSPQGVRVTATAASPRERPRRRCSPCGATTLAPVCFWMSSARSAILLLRSSAPMRISSTVLRVMSVAVLTT